MRDGEVVMVITMMVTGNGHGEESDSVRTCMVTVMMISVDMVVMVMVAIMMTW